MNNFTYYVPTKVIFGENVETQCGKLINEFSAKRVLIHFGSNRIKDSGLLEKVEKTLDSFNISYIELGGVKSNPRMELVREGVTICKSNDIDFILAIGGGSTIDSAKAIALGAKYDGDVADFYKGKVDLLPTLKSINKGVILTNAAAGSEMSRSSVITDCETGLKRSCKGDFNIIKFALLNPQLTTSLPPYQSASGGFDAAMHSIERYFSEGKLSSLTRSINVAIVKDIFHEIKLVLKNPNDLDARGNLMWASSLSHNSLTELGNTTRGDWSCHKLEHELGGMFDCAHGAGIAAVFTSWALNVYKELPSRFADFGSDIFDLPLTGDDEKDALRMIDKMKDFINEIGLPTNIPSLLKKELTEDKIEELSDKASNKDTFHFGSIKVLKKKDIKQIYKCANTI
jgi:alcohol dehydrogenase YqhD (iron-dependent ADH family)